MTPSLRKDVRYLLVLVALSTMLFGFRLGAAGLLDPDEPFYTLTAKEMLARGDFATPVLFGQPQFEKPIFFYWVECAAFKLFGINEFAARLGPCLAGIALILVTYLWGRLLFKRREIAFISAVVLATAAEVVAMARIVLTDMWLCLFVTAALCSFSAGYRYPGQRKLAWNFLFVFCALGFLTKGPLGLLLPFFGITAYLLWNKETVLFRKFPWVTGGVLFVIIGLSWYVQMTVIHGTWFLRHFFIHENVRRFFVAEHKNSDKIFFYPLVIFGGFFPWSVFLPAGLWVGIKEGFKKRTARQQTFLFLSLSFLLPLVFFTAARSKLMSYIFPVFPVLALMLGAWLYLFYRAVRRKAKIKFSLSLLGMAIWGIFPLALVIGTLVYNAQNDVGIFWEIIWLGAALIPLSWACLLWFLRKKLKAAFWALVFMVICFASLVFGFLMPAADIAFASQKEARIYATLTQGRRPGLLLASKLFVRGAVYYTGNANAAVLAEDPRNLFYTKHPIPIYSTNADLLRIDRKDFPVYCFLRQKELKLLKKIIDPNLFSIEILESNAQRVFLKLDRANSGAMVGGAG